MDSNNINEIGMIILKFMIVFAVFL